MLAAFGGFAVARGVSPGGPSPPEPPRLVVRAGLSLRVGWWCPATAARYGACSPPSAASPWGRRLAAFGGLAVARGG